MWCSGTLSVFRLTDTLANTSRKHGENRSRFPITDLLTTMLCSREITANMFFLAFQLIV